jgi:hypothetical protein
MNFTDSHLDRLIVHYIGNKQNGQSILLSRQSPVLDKASREKLSTVYKKSRPRIEAAYYNMKIKQAYFLKSLIP